MVLGRRLVFALTIAFMANYPLLQILTTSYASLLMAGYVMTVRPHAGKVEHFINSYNEFFILFLSSYVFLFTDYTTDSMSLVMFGKIFLYFIAAALVANVVALSVMVFYLLRFNYRVHRASLAWKKFHLLKLAGIKKTEEERNPKPKATVLEPIAEEIEQEEMRPKTPAQNEGEEIFNPHENSEAKMIPGSGKIPYEHSESMSDKSMTEIQMSPTRPRVDLEEVKAQGIARGSIMPNVGNRKPRFTVSGL